MADKEQKNDWDKFDDGMLDEPILMSDYEHKAHLIKTNIKSDIINAEDVITKELQLSFLDGELAYIYGIKNNCAEEWRNLGLTSLAKRRMVHLVVKLNILKSTGGFERILQTAIANTSANIGSSGELPTAKEITDQANPNKKVGEGWKRLLKT